MNKKFDKETFYEYFENGLTNPEIAAITGAAISTIVKVKRDWKNERTFTMKEKIEANDINELSKVSDIGSRLYKLEPFVLNAIYRFSKWQTIFFSNEYNAYFDGDNKINNRIFNFFKKCMKEVGHMPSQERISEMWEEYLFSLKENFSEYDKEEMNDTFDKIVWNLDEDVNWLDKKCNEYIKITESMNFIDKARRLIIGDCSMNELDDLIARTYRKMDIKNNEIVSMSDEIEGETVKFYPFFLNGITKIIGGLPEGVNTICGCTGSGKTMACVNQEVFLARQKIAVLHFILGDIGKVEYQSRLLSHLSRIDCKTIMNDRDLRNRLKDEYKDILEYIYVYHSNESHYIEWYLNQIEIFRKKCAQEHNHIPSFIVFDYDDLIATRNEEPSKQAVEVYETARQYGASNHLCILMVAQPTKDANTRIRDEGRDMRLSDISGGKCKADKSGYCIGFSSPKHEPGQQMWPVTFELMKTRYGGEGTKVQVLFEGNACTYHEKWPVNEEFETEEDPCGWKFE